MFNRIANDLAEVKDDLSSAEKRDVRTVAQLRFAGELSPEAFGEHVVQEHSGRFVLKRLPAGDDPQFERALSVRDREHLFVETLNEHYVDVYEKSKDSYHGWRETARQEVVAMRELRRSGRWRTVFGVVGMIASVALALENHDDFSDTVVTDSLMQVSIELLESAQVRRGEMRIHAEALEEFSESFDAEVKPMVVEIDGIQRRLTPTGCRMSRLDLTVLPDDSADIRSHVGIQAQLGEVSVRSQHFDGIRLGRRRRHERSNLPLKVQQRLAAVVRTRVGAQELQWIGSTPLLHLQPE